MLEFSNLDLGVYVNKIHAIRSMRWLTSFFFAPNLSELTSMAREVLAIDPSLDHIIKPVITEILHQSFYAKEITLDAFCAHVYDNQDVIDVVFFIKCIQFNTTIEPSDVIQLFEKYKNNSAFIVFLQRLHLMFDEAQLKPNHEKKIFA